MAYVQIYGGPMSFCGGGFFPSILGEIIRNLKPGDEVIILQGEGYPPLAKETATIIWKVNGFSALAANGTTISCQSISDLIVTGRNFTTYTVSVEALNLWNEIFLADKECHDSDQKPDWTVPIQFPTEPE